MIGEGRGILRCARIGKCYALICKEKLGLLVGPQWPLIFAMSALILAVLIWFAVVIAPFLEGVYQAVGVFMISFVFLTYIVTALMDPGVVLNDCLQEFIDHSLNICEKCLVYKDDTTEHCDSCEVCMKRLDHHCVFTGKCIASNNICCFNLMLASIFLSLFYMLYLVIFILPSALKLKSLH